VRNSLRLFGLLTVLGAVNVYVFFFNHGTAPREVLKPSTLSRSTDGKGSAKSGSKSRATITPKDLPGAETPPGTDDLDPAGSVGFPAATLSGPEEAPAGALKPTAAAESTARAGGAALAQAPVPAPAVSGSPSPKGQPGGSPGEDDDAGQSPEKRIGPSDTLGQILVREGFAPEVAARITAALSRLFDPRLIRAGQSYRVRLDEQGEPEAFELRPSAVTRFAVTRGSGSDWVVTRVDQSVDIQVASVAGVIESSLYESVQKVGETSALAGLLVELLAWDVNFFTDTHPGDTWKVVVEKQYLGGAFYRYGHILAAEYGGKVGPFRAFYWRSGAGEGAGHYFDERGQAIAKTLLKTPLRFVRVSSTFDRHRFHPILHREKAHLGIDYAAPVGTPVWASSAGKVVECQMKRGSGNTVVLAHANGLATRYYHLSRFARGLKVGKLVRQKEVIGFVGTTGLSTGPHLHFSVTQNGAFVDPGKLKMSRDAPVPDRGAYLGAVRERMAVLRQLQPAALARN
jgi:murein DD-endopeptidase MepM/ murein hydrolase activator NlpD